MASREENMRKINEQLELLSDEELERVVGGICTLYLFLYIKDPKNSNMVYWCKALFALGLDTNPFTWAADFLYNNSGWIFNQGENSQYTSNDDFRNYVQSFANDNASQWSNPLTWGNLVFSAGNDGGERFDA